MNYLTMSSGFVKTHTAYLSEMAPTRALLSDNNNQPNGADKSLEEVWSKYKFESNSGPAEVRAPGYNVTWAKAEQEVKVEEDEEEEEEPKEKEEESSSPSHHARRPMNAFLIFCKKHRPIVRERYPNLENRGVTRILGEWWALLDEADKAPYTGLAKEYKDAFLSANPNFKWYKLPAPPLRTLNVRPIHKAPSPISSPTHFSIESEFTPGKLADESQLGSLTSLMNNNYSPKIVKPAAENNNNNNNNNNIDEKEKPPTPPKPLKKRPFDNHLLDEEERHGSLTQQELMDKVVDNIFTKSEYNGHKEVRKSGRQCKGKRYEKFMVEGRLLGNKRDAKLTSQRSIEDELSVKLETKPEPETPNLDHTIRRLAERTSVKVAEERTQHDSNTNFDLNQRINSLPSLSYDVFHQRKKESKKRKSRARGESEAKRVKLVKNDQPVGSKKRKNKQSITHLKEESGLGSELLALATLAEVAANTEKINSE